MDPSASPARRPRLRAAAASLVGTSVEYYDFYLYGTAAALVFSPQFFPSFSPAVGLLASFGVFGAGFVARPLGGVVMGHFGDRVGRKSMLVFSLLLVGAGTFLIGLLPNYATIGVWAPILLVFLRLVQGFGVGGEWSGAVLMSVEHAPRGREGFYGVIPQLGIPVGLGLANIAFLAASASGQFADWVWRLPFLFSGVLIVFGLFVRIGVAESPAFAELDADDKKSRRPIVEVAKKHLPAVLVAAGLPVAPFAVTYIFTTYGVSYMTAGLGLSTGLALGSVLVGVALFGLNMLVAGRWCDRYGAVRVFKIGCFVLLGAVAAYFPLLNTRHAAMLMISSVLLSAGLALTYGPVAVLISRRFPVNLRYSGSSLAYQIGTLVGAAPAPFLAAAIFAATHSWIGIACFMAAAVAISIAAGFATASGRAAGPAEEGRPAAREANDRNAAAVGQADGKGTL